jgi:hypothetical protein
VDGKELVSVKGGGVDFRQWRERWQVCETEVEGEEQQ